ESRVTAFETAVRHYWPALPDHALVPGYVGVRPKLGPPGAPPHDFVIQGPAEHGVPGLVNLFGIESPGLTAALAIAETVASMVYRDRMDWQPKPACARSSPAPSRRLARARAQPQRARGVHWQLATASTWPRPRFPSCPACAAEHRAPFDSRA